MDVVKFETAFLNEYFHKLIKKETICVEELQRLKNVMITANNVPITQYDFDLLRKMPNIQFEGINLDGLEYKVAEIDSLNGATDENIEMINNLNTDRILLYSFRGLTEEILDKMSDRIKFLVENDYLAYNHSFYTYYTKDDLKRILSVMKTIKALIPNDATDINKFLIVYRFIGMNASLDLDAKVDSIINPLKHVTEEKELSPRSLKGVLLDGKAVCHGNSLALCMCLDYVGIDAKFVSGFMNEEPHGWVQVKIDGIWYNACLTTDWGNIRRQDPLEYCLRNDEYFLNHGFKFEGYWSKKDINTNLIRCVKDYPRKNNGQILGDSSFKVYEYFDNLERIYQIFMQSNIENENRFETNEIDEKAMTNGARR